MGHQYGHCIHLLKFHDDSFMGKKQQNLYTPPVLFNAPIGVTAFHKDV